MQGGLRSERAAPWKEQPERKRAMENERERGRKMDAGGRFVRKKMGR